MDTKTTKTVDQAIKEWLAGKLSVVVEYRGSRAEPIKWRDKDTHMTLSAVTLTHSVESESTTLMVSERVDDNFDWKEYKPPFRKGDKVLCSIDTIGKNKGVTTIYGRLEALTDGGRTVPDLTAGGKKP